MCFTASNIQPQQAAGRPAIHTLRSASRITKCGLKKDLSRTPQGNINDMFFLENYSEIIRLLR